MKDERLVSLMDLSAATRIGPGGRAVQVTYPHSFRSLCPLRSLCWMTWKLLGREGGTRGEMAAMAEVAAAGVVAEAAEAAEEVVEAAVAAVAAVASEEVVWAHQAGSAAGAVRPGLGRCPRSWPCRPQTETRPTECPRQQPGPGTCQPLCQLLAIA